MAVVQMERIRLLAMRRDRKAVLELLQRRGAVEVSDAAARDEVFGKADTSASRALLEKNAETACAAIELLSAHCAEKKPFLGFLNGRNAVAVSVDAKFVSVRETVLRVAQRIVQLNREAAEARAELLRAEGQLEALSPWLGMPVPLAFAGTKKTAAFIGSVEGQYDEGALLAALAKAAPALDPVHVEVTSGTREQTCFYALCLKKDAALCEGALRELGFTRPAQAGRRLPPDEQKRLEELIGEKRAAAEKAGEDIAAYAGRMDDLRYLQDHMTMRAEKYGVIERLLHSRHVFALEGYAPARIAPRLREELLGKFECDVELSPAPCPGEEVPVLLRNNAFVQPGETVLENYSLPGAGDIDPTPLMSVFYYLMFGLMFSDAGYGLIMAAVCGVLLRTKKRMEPGWRKNLGLFFWCGVSTVFWGVLFGSYFGNAVPAVSEAFFGQALIIRPVWLDPLQSPMTLLMFCLGLGVVHLSFGMALKAVTCVKNRQYLDILYDVVFPLAVVYPLLLILMGSEMFYGMAQFRLALPTAVNTAALGVAGAGAVGVVLFGGRESKNWFKRTLKGLYALYNVAAGWLGDILSYSRLLALGLATGVIATVINNMGVMVGGGVVGAVAFVVIFAVGQALNFGINVLGAYVHSNRLEFVELFGKFYEGGGRKFAPFGIHTKYYKIEEDD